MWWETNGVLEYKTQLKFTKMIWTNMMLIHNHHLILLHHDLHHHHHLHVDDEFFSKPHAFFFHAWQRGSLACPVYPHWLPRSPLSAHHCWCKRALGWTKPGRKTNHSLVAMDTLGGGPMWKACRWPGLAVGLELANLWQRFHHLEGLTPLQNFEHSHDPNSEAEWLFCLAILLLGPFPMLRAFSNCFARP